MPSDTDFSNEIDSILRRKMSDEMKQKLIDVIHEREQTARNRAIEHRQWRYSTPLAIALTGLITLAGNFAFNALQARNESGLALRMEERRFQLQLMKDELSQRETERERASVLLFLVRAGVLDGLNETALREMAEATLRDNDADALTAPPTIPRFAPRDITIQPTPAELEALFETVEITSERVAQVSRLADRIEASRTQYETVSAETGVPWTVIGALHSLEGLLNFNRHLHNGDPLTARTIRVPAGRPHLGTPPFTWEESAIDALALSGLAGRNLTSLGTTLEGIEAYNGFGYRRRGIYSPYLWACTSAYSSGAFVADGVFDESAVAASCGAAPILRELRSRGHLITAAAD